MEDLLLLILRTINFQWRPLLLPQRFLHWHLNCFSCSLANRSQVLLPLLLLRRSPMAFLRTNCKLLLRDFRLWHRGALLILVRLRQLHRSSWNSGAIFRQKKNPAAAGCVCVEHLNRSSKTSIVDWITSCRGAQKAHRAVPNEALITWTYLHSFCTNFDVKLFFREWQPAKPRTGQMTPLRGLHVCRNLIFIYSLAYILFIGDIWRLFTIWTRFWSGFDFPNYILLVTYYFLEIYLVSTILFNCTFWDSVPDGSLQWSSSCLMCVCQL